MAAALLDTVQALVAQERYAEAAQRLIDAAEAGDPDALLELADWRIFGDILRRDLAAARRLLCLAAEAGKREAFLPAAAFLANGTGGPADWDGATALLRQASPWSPCARAQIELLAAMNLDSHGGPSRTPAKEAFSQAPAAWTARGFLTAAECDWLAEVTEPWLQPSVVVDPATGRMVSNPIRTSDGAQFGVVRDYPVVSAINRRIAALSATDLDQGEPLQVLRYRPGAEYKPHYDALPAGGNQRVATVLVYLTDDYEGGETAFLRTGLSFRGRKGDALLFRNVRPDGRPDPMSLHAGLPVRSGVKTIATRWIRERPFTFPPPEPVTGARFD